MGQECENHAIQSLEQTGAVVKPRVYAPTALRNLPIRRLPRVVAPGWFTDNAPQHTSAHRVCPATRGIYSMPTAPLLQSQVAGYPCRRGKVRDVYDLGDRLVIVATDRISAFDWVLPTGIPDKGRVLTGLTLFWLDCLGCPTTCSAPTCATWGRPSPPRPSCSRAGRCWCARRTVVPIECVVRGYLAGSGWKEYRQARHGLRHPAAAGPARERAAARADLHAGHQGGERPRPEHLLRARWPRSSAPDVAEDAAASAASTSTAGPPTTPATRGIIIADTKFEWGQLPDGELILIDEVLTPDSSRFWPADDYRAGRQPAVVRQAVRARLAGDDRLGQEQPAAGAAGRGGGADAGEVPGSVRTTDGTAVGSVRSMNSP